MLGSCCFFPMQDDISRKKVELAAQRGYPLIRLDVPGLCQFCWGQQEKCQACAVDSFCVTEKTASGCDTETISESTSITSETYSANITCDTGLYGCTYNHNRLYIYRFYLFIYIYIFMSLQVICIIFLELSIYIDSHLLLTTDPWPSAGSLALVHA